LNSSGGMLDDMRVERTLWRLAMFLRNYLRGGRSAFGFYRYDKDWVVGRVCEAEAGPDAWPVAAAWVSAPRAGAGFLDWRVKEAGLLPANVRFLAVHERTLGGLSPDAKKRVLSSLEREGIGLVTYTMHPKITVLLEPLDNKGQFSGLWKNLLEEIETCRFLEGYP
jgi:hypothetical protein